MWTAYCNCLDICFWIACTSMLIRKHFQAYFFLAISFLLFMPFSQENLANFQDWTDSILLFKTSVSSHATKHNKGGSHWTWFITIKMRTIDINGILFQKLLRLMVRKNCSSIREKFFEHLRIKVREFAKILRSLEQCTILNNERSEQFLKRNYFLF